MTTRQGHARRIVTAIDPDIRADIADDPRSAIEVHCGFTVQPATSFAERGARGWCDGMSETTSYTGTTRWWPRDECGTLTCPKCQACECTRRERPEKRAQCQRCFVVVRTHLLDESGCCKDGC